MKNLSTYNHKSYDGGLNNTDSPREIERDEAAVLTNWLVREKGKLIGREGLTAVGDALAGTAWGLHAYLRNTGSKDILLMDGASLKYLNSTTFDTLDSGFSAGKDFCFVNVQSTNKVYLCNEDNQLHSWDRAGVTLNGCLTDLGAAVPHGNVMVWFKNHLFHLNNLNISGVKYPMDMAWSNLGDPTAYTGSDKISLPNGGRLITACPLGESSLIIFQEHAIKFLGGYGSTDWVVTTSANSVDNIDESVGCLAPKGVVGVGDEVWFIDDEANIRRIYQTDFNAFRKDIISSKIMGSIANINKTQIAKVRAWVQDDYVMFAVPTGSSTVNNLVLAFDLIAAKRLGESGRKMESWTTFTGWTPDFFISYPTSTTPVMYMVSTTAGKVFKWEGDDDDGVAIAYRWDSKRDDYDKSDRYKRYTGGQITAESSSTDYDVDFYGSIDASAFSKIGVMAVTSDTGSKLGPTGTDTLGPTGVFKVGGATEGELNFEYQDAGLPAYGRTIQHSIRHSVVAKKPEINNFVAHYKLRSLTG